MAKKAVILVSGGLDSATVLAIAREQGYETYALSLDYGQRHRSELAAAASVALAMGAREHRVVKLDLTGWGGSALTDSHIDVPTGGATTGIPVTYVPARNTIFLSLSLAWAEAIGALWMQVQTESLGPAFDFTPDYACYWAYIPHFVHSPFYVYAYAFGDCLVNALYGVFQDGKVAGFEEKYLALLRAGGTLRHKELLAPFGLDASDPAFWQRGLDVISGFIDELEHAGG